MFSVNGNTLAQAHLQDDSIGKLVELPDEYSRILRMEDEQAQSNRSSLVSEIGGLGPGLKGVSFKARVMKKSAVRAVTSRNGTPLLACEVTLSDGTGEIPLPLWNNQISEVTEGDVVQIQNATVRRFRGRTQLSLGKKTGVLTILKQA